MVMPVILMWLRYLINHIRMGHGFWQFHNIYIRVKYNINFEVRNRLS